MQMQAAIYKCCGREKGSMSGSLADSCRHNVIKELTKYYHFSLFTFFTFVVFPDDGRLLSTREHIHRPARVVTTREESM